jgi:threonine/homoserine/homoserine lactone efflux protein
MSARAPSAFLRRSRDAGRAQQISLQIVEHARSVCSVRSLGSAGVVRRRGAGVLLAALLGMAIGYIGSMPVAGPIAVLVLGRGLEDRGRNGLFLALGSAIAEGVYAYLAFWGFSAFLASYPWIEPVARISAAILLVGLGVHFYRKRPETQPAERPANVGNKRSFFLGFTITALNPTLIATWTFTVTTVFSFGIVRFDAANALPFSLGAFCGIVGWFATMLYLLARFRSSFPRKRLDRLMRVTGLVLIVLGLGLGVLVGVRALRPPAPKTPIHAPPFPSAPGVVH